MRRPDDDALFTDIVIAARHLQIFMNGRTREDLANDIQLQFAVLKAIEIIGEAAGRLGDAARARAPRVAWREVIGMRHHLVHGYDRVQIDIVWDVIQNDVPALLEALEPLLPPDE